MNHRDDGCTSVAPLPQSASERQKWQSFLSKFCDYGDLYRSSAAEELRNYLQAKFRMSYESRDVLEGITTQEEVSRLTESLVEDKHNFELAQNDALMVHSIYGRRAANGEDAGPNTFGYQTWWLTTETKVLQKAASVVRDHKGARYMMRPDFLLNFFALAPSMTQVRQTYQRLFPSTLGLELSRRMDPNIVSEILDELRQAEEYDDARRLAIMSKSADRIKSDFKRRHLESLDRSKDAK